MLRQLIVVIGTLVNGSVFSYLAMSTLSRDMGIITAMLILGATLLALGFYVANNDPRRRLLEDPDMLRQMQRYRTLHSEVDSRVH